MHVTHALWVATPVYRISFLLSHEPVAVGCDITSASMRASFSRWEADWACGHRVDRFRGRHQPADGSSAWRQGVARSATSLTRWSKWLDR